MIGYILLGFTLAHVAWALVFVAMWWQLVRDLPSEKRGAAVNQDFQKVRDAIRRRQGHGPWN